MKRLFLLFVIVAAVATAIKACSNNLFVEGHPHSHIEPTTPKAAQNIGSFIAEYQPSTHKIEVNGKEYKISRAWAEYRTKLSHRLIWFPIYPRTEGLYITITFEDDIAVDNHALKNVPFWLNLESSHYTYLNKNQFTGMSNGEPQANYIFIATNRSSKEEITRIQLKKK